MYMYSISQLISVKNKGISIPSKGLGKWTIENGHNVLKSALKTCKLDIINIISNSAEL